MEIIRQTSKADSPRATVIALDGCLGFLARITPNLHLPSLFCSLYLLCLVPTALHTSPSAHNPQAGADRANAAKLEANYDYASAITQCQNAYAPDKTAINLFGKMDDYSTAAAGTVSRGADAVSQSTEQSNFPPFLYVPKTPFAHPFYWDPFIPIWRWNQ